VLLLGFFTLIGPETASTNVGTIERDFPAAKVLKPGDELIAVDGRRGDPVDLSRQIMRHSCPGGRRIDGCAAATPATLLIRRDGRTRTIRVRPIYDSETKRPRLGFSYAPGDRETLAFGEGFDLTANRFWFISKETVALPARLFDEQKRKEITGVVGSYEVTRQTILEDIGEVIGILAIISLSLAIVNLFPFLPLDGGHIFWALVELVRRKPVPYSVMERAGVVGFMLVLALFFLGLSNDIDRLSGEGFNTR
jgi:regulator of sigma E protease